MTAAAAPDDALARSLLATLPGMGPARLAWLLSGAPAPEAFEALCRGRIGGDPGPAPPGVTPALVEGWASHARKLSPAAEADALARLGVSVLTPSSPAWPFAQDPHPPVVLFALGHLGLLAPTPRVALVGTRRCSAVGRQAAYQLGRDLAQGGATVVSGLASGVDGAAHAGALAATTGDPAPTIAVVGTGLDRIYPAVNRRLWGEVAARGLLLSESPLGARPEPWRFPARNRLIAGLCAVTVVVESHSSGGALLTANEAVERGATVMAVPGAITSSASAGSNQLLADGCPPVCCAADVFHQLGLDPAGPAGGGAAGPSMATDGGDVGPLARLILDEASAGAIHVDQLVAVAGRPAAEVMAELHRLRTRGLVQVDGSTVLYG